MNPNRNSRRPCLLAAAFLLCAGAALADVVNVTTGTVFTDRLTPTSGTLTLSISDGAIATFENIVSGNTTDGGAIYINPPSSFTLNLLPAGSTGRTEFLGNSGRTGGAINFSVRATGTLVNVRFGAIDVAGSGNSAYGGHGGALYVGNSTITLANVEFYRNTTTRVGTAGGYGGAAMFNSGGAATFVNATFGSMLNPDSGNTAINGYGGALALVNAGAIVSMSNANFFHNTALYQTDFGGSGGALFLNAGGKITITSGTFYGNRAISNVTGAGGTGGVMRYDTTETSVFTDIVFAGNYALRLGGVGLLQNTGTVVFNITKDLAWSGNYAGGATAATAIASTGGLLYFNSAASTVTFGIAPGKTLTVGDAANANLDTIAGAAASGIIMVNPGASPAGTLLLHGDSSAFKGAFGVHGGRVLLGNNNARLGASSITVKTSGTLGGIGATGTNVTVENGGAIQAGVDGSGLFKVNGALAMAANTKFTGGGTLSATAITLGAAAGDMVGAEIAAGSTVNIASALSGPGGLAKTGAGTLLLSTANTFSGNSRMDDGALALGNNTSLGAGTLVITGGTLAFAGALAVTNAIALSGSAALLTSANDSTLSGALTGAGAFDKTGAGKLTLANASAFTGAAGVSGGVLTGALTNASVVAVRNTGVYEGNLSRNAGQTLVAAGGSISGDLNLAGGKMSFDLRNSAGAAGTYDTLALTGNLATAAGSIIDLSNIGGAPSYTIVSAGNLAGASTAHFGFTVNGLAPTNRHTPSIAFAGNTIVLTTGLRNLRMTWTGGDSAAPALWDTLAANWSDQGSSGEKQFHTGDSVRFNTTASALVPVAAAGVTVGDIGVTVAANQTHTFAGGGITADAATSDSDGHTAGADGSVWLPGGAAAATGKLVKSGAGALVFSNSANLFKGGVEIQDGVLAFTNPAQLGDGG